MLGQGGGPGGTVKPRFGTSDGTWRYGEGRTLVTKKQRISTLGIVLGIIKIVAASHAASLQGGDR